MHEYKTIVIDGMNYCYKAFYAMPRLTTLRRIRTEVIFGFMNNMQKIYQQYRPQHFIVCWDSKVNKRKRMNKLYKSKRQEQSAEIIEMRKQVTELKKWLPSIGIHCIEKEGYESDDIMAILASKKQLHKMLICTGDNDLHQCIRKDVHVFDKNRVYTLKDIEAKYGYKKPYLVAIEKALAGCNSDNVQGIAGIGEKKAAAIIQKGEGNVTNIFSIVDGELKADEEFNEALSLVYLPLKRFSVPLPSDKHHINRHKLAEMMCYFDITKFNATTFLQ